MKSAGYRAFAKRRLGESARYFLLEALRKDTLRLIDSASRNLGEVINYLGAEDDPRAKRALRQAIYYLGLAASSLEMPEIGNKVSKTARGR